MSNVLYGPTNTADTKRRKSPALWQGFPVDRIRNGELGGRYIDFDFTEGGEITAVTTDASLVNIPWNGFNSSGGTHTFGADKEGTLIVTEATDNEASYVRHMAWPFQISSALGELVFETRIKVSAITDNQIGFICGLWTNVACSVIVPLSTANPPIMATTGDFVGFWGREEDAGLVGSTYKAGGVAGAGGLAVQAGIHQFVADTYVKLGMRFFPNYKGSGVASLAFYVNGVEQATRKTVPDNTGTDFPADVPLGFMFGHRLGAGTSSLTTCDWVKCYQLDAIPE